MKKARKLLAVLLCLTMCFSLLPTWAFAEEAKPEETAATEVIAEEAEEAQVVETPAEPDEETPADTENAMQEDAEVEIASDGDPDEGGIEPMDDPDGVAISEENFPDEAFRELVSDFDTDPDGVLSGDEIAEVTELIYEGIDIADLTGIEFFTELEVLEFGADPFGDEVNPLSSVDLSCNTRLVSLSFLKTELSFLDVSMLPELAVLTVGFSNISELDLSGNPLLEELICNDADISDLDLSCNPELWKLDCCGNPGLTVLDISACPYLIDQYENDEWSPEEKEEYPYLENIRVFGYGDDGYYTFAVNDYTEIICEAPDLFEEFREACENEEDGFDLSDLGEFTIEESLTIPRNMFVNAEGTTIVIPDGVTLTVEGGMNAQIVEVQSTDEDGGGKLVIRGYAGIGSLEADGTVRIENWADNNIEDISGTGTIELENDWMNIPAEIWTDDVRDMMSYLGDNCGVNIHLDAQDEEDIWNASEAAPIEEHVRPNIHIVFAWEPEEDFEVPEDVSFHIEEDGGLTVPEEVSFEVNGYLGLHGAEMTVEGTLINNGMIELMESSGASGQLTLDRGSYEGIGEIEIRTPCTLEGSLIGFDLDGFVMTESDDDHIRGRFVNLNEVYELFREACENEEDAFDLSNFGEFTILDDLTIPECMHVEAWGTTVIVPDYVTLTVNGNLEAEGIEVQGEDEDANGELLVLGRVYAESLVVDGKVVLDNWADADFKDLGGSGSVDVRDAWLNLPLEVWNDAGEMIAIDPAYRGGVNIHLDADDEEGIWDALDAVEGVAEERVHPNIHVHFEWILEENFDFPGGVNFQIERDGGLTIPEGISFEACGCLGIRGADVTVGGTLINNGRIELTENDGDDPCLNLDGGSYQGMGEIWIEHPYTPETVLQGFDMNKLNQVNEDENGTTWVYGSVYEMLKAAIVNGPDEEGGWSFRLPDNYELTVTENMTIPAGMNIEGWNTKIVVSGNVTLTVEGSEEYSANVNVGALEIAGTVRIVGTGSLNVEGLWNENGLAEAVTTSGTGVLKLEGTQVQVMIPMEADLSAANIQYLYGAQLKLHAVANSADELVAALDAFALKNNGTYRAFIEILDDCVLAGSLEIPVNAEVLVINADAPWGSFAGGLTVPNGVTLTVNGFLGIQNAELAVEGTLANNAQINLELAYGRLGDSGYLQVTDGGSYRGLGNIWVNGDDPDSHVDVPNPDVFIVEYQYDHQGDIRGASFRIGSYGITYDIAGASGTQPDARFGIPFGEEVLLAPQGDLTKEGYVFAGWYNVMTDAFYPADTLGTPIADLNVRTDEEGNTVYCDFVVLGAVWDREGYVVRFDGNGADGGSMDEQYPDQYDQYQDGYRVFLMPNAFVRDGYTFIGWNTRADGSGRSYGDCGVVNLSPELVDESDGLTLYAQWKQLPFAVFDIESGKKLDLAKASAVSGAVWTLTSGGQYASVTAKGALTAKAVTELQTVYAEAVKDGDTWLIEVNIFPKATAVWVNYYTGDDQADAFDNREEWETAANGQTIYVPYDGTQPTAQALRAVARPNDAMQGAIKWTASDKGKIVELDTADGFGQLIVRPKKAGTVTLTATCGKAKATVKLVIGNFIQDVSIRTTDAKGKPIFVTWTSSRNGTEYPAVRGGSTVTLLANYDGSVKYADSGLVWELVNWNGRDENGDDIWVPGENPYAKLTPAGKLTTSVMGEAWTAAVRVSVKANPEICDVLEFVIAPAVQSVSIVPLPVTGLQVGETVLLEAEVVPSRAAGELTWKSSNTKVAVVTVDDDGEVSVEGRGAGTVTITATAADGSKKSASVKLTVANPTAVNINDPAKTELAGGEKLTLSVAGSPKVTWASSDTSVAAVTAKGVVTAMKIARDAEVVITATAADGTADSVPLTVKASAIATPVNTISITGAGSVIGGNKLTLKAAVTDPKKPTNKTLLWSSSDPSVAVVSAKGVVTTMPVDEPKNVVITVAAADGAGAQAQAMLSVYPKVRGIEISINGDIANGTTRLVSRTDEVWIHTTVFPFNSMSTAVTWKSSNAKIAQVAGERLDFSGGKTGTVTLTATSTDGSKVKATVKLTVVNAVWGVKIINGNTKLTAGKKLTLKAEINPENATNKKLIWSIRPEDAAYATISQKGVVTAKKVTDFHVIRVMVTSAENEYAGAWTNIYLYPAS